MVPFDNSALFVHNGLEIPDGLPVPLTVRVSRGISFYPFGTAESQVYPFSQAENPGLSVQIHGEINGY